MALYLASITPQKLITDIRLLFKLDPPELVVQVSETYELPIRVSLVLLLLDEAFLIPVLYCKDGY